MKENIPALIEQKYMDWEHLYQNGCSDSFWPDGVNLDLLRNHIISYKRQMAGTLLEFIHADLFNRELPPEVDRNYMAKPDEIRNRAVNTLELYKRDRHYQCLCGLAGTIPPDVRRTVSYDTAMGYARRLEAAIRDDDLLTMRLHSDPENNLRSFEWCVEKIRRADARLLLDTDPQERAVEDEWGAENAVAESYETYTGSTPLLRLG